MKTSTDNRNEVFYPFEQRESRESRAAEFSISRELRCHLERHR